MTRRAPRLVRTVLPAPRLVRTVLPVLLALASLAVMMPATASGFDVAWQADVASPFGGSVFTDVLETANGDIVVAGTGALTSAEPEAVLARYDASGELLWMLRRDAANSVRSVFHLIGEDKQGSLYVWSAEADQTGFVVAKYSATGRCRWERPVAPLSGATYFLIQGVVTREGTAYMSFGYGTTPYGQHGSGLLRVDRNGHGRWTRTFATAGISNLAADPEDGVYVTGWQAAAPAGAYVRRYSSRGEIAWERFYTPREGAEAEGVTLTVTAEDVLVAGWCRWYPGSSEGAFLLRYGRDGTPKGVVSWLDDGRLESDPSAYLGGPVASDAGGNAYLTLHRVVPWQPGWTEALKIAPDGKVVYSTPVFNNASPVGVRPDGSLVLADGWAVSAMEFGRLDPAGEVADTYSHQWVNGDFYLGWRLILTRDGDLLAVGEHGHASPPITLQQAFLLKLRT